MYIKNKKAFRTIMTKTKFVDDRVKIMKEYKDIYKHQIKIEDGVELWLM